jgi:hypothetical protein
VAGVTGLVGWAKALFAPCPPALFDCGNGGHASLCPPHTARHCEEQTDEAIQLAAL